MVGYVSSAGFPDSDREHHDTTQRDPRPAPLTQREHPYLASPRDRVPGGGGGGGGNPLEADEDEVLERVANQLKTIGDDLNATLLQRRVRNKSLCD